MAGSMKKLKASLQPRIDNRTIRYLTLNPFVGIPVSLNPLSVDHLFSDKEIDYPTYEELEEEERHESKR